MQTTIRRQFGSLAALLADDEVSGIVSRMNYASAEALWNANPTVRTDGKEPEELSRADWDEEEEG